MSAFSRMMPKILALSELFRSLYKPEKSLSLEIESTSGLLRDFRR